MDVFTPEQRRELLQRVLTDPKSIDELNENEIAAAKKEINHLATAFTDSQCFANITLIGMRDTYLRGFYSTALIGYIFRQAYEYEHTATTISIMEEFTKATEHLQANSPELAEAVAERDKTIKSKQAEAKKHVIDFLGQAFTYNPDRHVRGAHLDDAGRAIPERVAQYNQLHNRVNTYLKSAPEIQRRLEANSEKTIEYAVGAIMSTKTLAEQAITAVAAAHDAITAGHSTADALGLLTKQYAELVRISEDVGKIAGPLSAAQSAAALRVEPPADMFYQFNRYIDNNYEYLRVITDLCYPYVSDIEFGITLHSIHDTAEEANEFRETHQAEFVLPVQTVASGGMTLFGPFKQNRDKVNYYNKNTELLRKMTEYHESATRLIDDMNKKRISNDKKKNIADVGPDDEELKEYVKIMNQTTELGAKPGLTEDEKKELAEKHRELQKIKESIEVPDGAIRTHVIEPVQNSEGEVVGLETKILYTQAEEPIHMDPAAPQGYQPVRAEGVPVEAAYKKEKLVVAGREQIIKTLKTPEELATSKPTRGKGRGRGKKL